MSYHPKIDGESKKGYSDVKRHITSYIMKFIGNWMEHQISIKFAYNNFIMPILRCLLMKLCMDDYVDFRCENFSTMGATLIQ